MVGHVRLVGFKVADNVENGMVVTEAHGDWGGPLIKVRGLLEVMCVCVHALSVCLFSTTPAHFPKFWQMQT